MARPRGAAVRYVNGVVQLRPCPITLKCLINDTPVLAPGIRREERGSPAKRLVWFFSGIVMADLDELLMERVFQPVTDQVAGQVSCFDLARLSLSAAIALEAALLAYDLNHLAAPTQRVLVVAGTLMAFAAAQAVRSQIARAERAARPGMMNLNRVVLRPFRLLWIGLGVVGVASLAVSGGTAAMLNAAATFGWLSAVYLMCCVPAPPAASVGASHWAFAGD